MPRQAFSQRMDPSRTSEAARAPARPNRSKWEFPAVLTLLVLGFALRLLFLDSLPFGLNQDEASAGYDAWALLRYGIDRCGDAWPVLLTSWGSGQNALMSYLCMPLIAAFGLSEFSLRLVNALFGCATLIVFWRVARRARGIGFGICALFVLVVCPWHIMASRWALESNLLPFFLLFGIYFILKAETHPWFLVGAAVAFAAALYAYGTAFFFLPSFALMAFFAARKNLRSAAFLASALLFALLSFPIAFCQLRNALRLEEFSLWGLTLPRLTEGRQLSVSVFGDGLGAARENFISFLRMFWTQTDALSYNAISSFGLFYFGGSALAAPGLILSLWERRRHPPEVYLRVAAYACLFCACLITPNINRMNMVWLPAAYFISVPLFALAKKARAWSALPIAGVCACLLLFLIGYQARFGRQSSSEEYYPGLGQAIFYAESQNPESVYVTDFINQPYIFALFYTKTPPADFLETVDYPDPGAAFRSVHAFGHFRFGAESEAVGEYAILHNSESASGYAEIARFGSYVVCARQSP